MLMMPLVVGESGDLHDGAVLVTLPTGPFRLDERVHVHRGGDEYYTNLSSVSAPHNCPKRARDGL
jgi:hypothetical protein